jgi:hypothetical protein
MGEELSLDSIAGMEPPVKGIIFYFKNKGRRGINGNCVGIRRGRFSGLLSYWSHKTPRAGGISDKSCGRNECRRDYWGPLCGWLYPG